MRIDSPTVKEGTRIENLVCPIGVTFPPASEGELFRLRGHATILAGLYIYDNGEWSLLGKSLPFCEYGSNVTIDINTSSPVPVPLNLTYYAAPSTFELASSGVRVKVSGNYEIYYSINLESEDGSTKTVGSFIRKLSGLQTISKSVIWLSITDKNSNDVGSMSVIFKTPLNAGDILQLCGVRRASTKGTAYTISDNTIFGIRKID